ncbi:uncharacterized protein LOC27207729 [Drosophila simulans]|uniref:Uncharacterized protein, isoform B n=1 Tax=Drosophila simulans TaxID=7240 RepID=A0A0J9UIR4_DROSI|nr:uncharacterized protein LOC27207729 [Drosophila simulans]KMY98880.1 uncharacterized protein Dsimw501_GD27880, isoform B [Drosophila simulans]
MYQNGLAAKASYMGSKPKAKQGQDEQDAGGAKEQINRPQNRTNTKQTKCERTLNCDGQQKIALRWALGNELDRRTTKIFEELPQSVLRRKRKGGANSGGIYFYYSFNKTT